MEQKESRKSKTKLFSEFPPVSTEEWEGKIKKDLKGTNYEKKLFWKTNDGFKVKPYYRKEDLKDLDYLNSYPGDFPYVRGNKKNNNNWHIRQDIDAKDIEKANEKAQDILNKGIDSIAFILDEEKNINRNDLDKLLKNININNVEINFICGYNSQKIIEILLELSKQNNWDIKNIKGSVDFDPLGYLTLRGNFYNSEEYSITQCKSMIEAAEELRNFRVIAVNGKIFNNSGASIIEELGFSLAVGNEYISRLTDHNLFIDKIAPRIKFNFSVGSNYFLEIAKLRAARILWANIVKAYKPSKDAITEMNIHSSTSEWNKTIYDPYINILRSATESMSSIIGGIDSLTVNPFNKHFEKTTDFSERIARNQQIILKEESYFDKIVDPSAGSYYIENLTNSIAEHSWELFLEVEEKGGYTAAFKQGFIQKTVKETIQKRDMDIATRKENFVGTNQFPNFKEHIEKEIDNSRLNPIDLTEKNAIAETLKPYRATQAFETLRLKTDKYSKVNKCPRVYMLPYGNLSMRKARSQFACNFFACAGFEVIDNNGFKTIDQGVKASIENKADIVVICSSDEEYADIVPGIYEKLKDKAIVVVAGYPKAIIDRLKSKGINNFIHLKSNVLETLRNYQQKLGIM